MQIEITPELLADLKDKAKKATQGEWKASQTKRIYGGTDWKSTPVVETEDDYLLYMELLENSANDAEYIAAANPAVMLALIARIEELENENRALKSITPDKR